MNKVFEIKISYDSSRIGDVEIYNVRLGTPDDPAKEKIQISGKEHLDIFTCGVTLGATLAGARIKT